MKKVNLSAGSFFLFFLAALASCAGPARPAPAADYWISPQGRAGAAGSYEDPFSSPVDAAVRCTGGELVMFRSGTYRGGWTLQDLSFPTSITFRGEPGAVLEGDNQVPLGISILGCSNLVVQDLSLRNFTSAGVQVLFSSGITLERLLVQDCGRGTAVSERQEEGYGINAKYSDGITIRNCRTDACGPAPERVAEGVLGTGINTYLLTRSLIEGNHSRNSIGGGLLVEDGIEVTVRNNLLEDNWGIAPLPGGGKWTCGGIWVDGGENIILSANRITGNRIGIYITDLDCQKPEKYVVEDNLIAGNDLGLQVLGLGLSGPSDGILEIKNNEWSGNAQEQQWDGESWGIAFQAAGSSLLGTINGDPRVLFNPGTALFSADAVLEDGTRLTVVQSASWEFTQGRDFVLQDSLSGISSVLFVRIRKGLEIYEGWYDTDDAGSPFRAEFVTDGSSPRSYTLTSAAGSELYRWGYTGSTSISVPPGTLLSLVFRD